MRLAHRPARRYLSHEHLLRQPSAQASGEPIATDLFASRPIIRADVEGRRPTLPSQNVHVFALHHPLKTASNKLERIHPGRMMPSRRVRTGRRLRHRGLIQVSRKNKDRGATLRSRREIGTGLGERLCRSTGVSTDPRHFGGFATPWPMIAMLNTLTWGSSICRGGREPMRHRQRQFLKALLLCFLFSLVATAWIYVLYNSPR